MPTSPLNVSPADKYAGKREKRLVDIGMAAAKRSLFREGG